MNRKELIKQYKQTTQPMGVYQIQNRRNGKLFIGSTKNLPGKLNSHKFQLNNGVHTNKEMQKEFNEIGEEGFSFDILDCLKPKEDLNYDYTEELKTLEEMWMEKLQPFNEKGYNKMKIR
ncbi:MAG: GIY-YIG nuclease family protein [Desulfococcaceae bacterium]